MNITEATASLLPRTPAGVSVIWRKVIPGLKAHMLWIDPEKHCVLIRDGWGVAFSSLRLRALHLEDGRELASVRLGNAARALTVGEDGNWLAATDTKLFRLERSSLKPLGKWTRNIPRYSDDLVSGGGFVHTANHASSGLCGINLETGVVKRRVLADDVRIHATGGEGLIAVCGNGSIWSAGFGLTIAPEQIVQTPPVCYSAVDCKSGLWLSLGEGLLRKSGMVFRAEATSLLGFTNDPASGDLLSVDLGLPFREFAVSRDGTIVSIIGNPSREEGHGGGEQSDVASFATSNYACSSWVRVPDGFEVQLVSPDMKIGFATKSLEQGAGTGNAAELLCFGF